MKRKSLMGITIGARRLGIVSLVSLVAIALAACGSSQSSGQATSTPQGNSTGTAAASGGASGSPITIGAICSCSGSGGTAHGQIMQVYQAWQSEVNANGGINGHPVNLIIKDDTSNASTALLDAKELVADHVIAVVGETSLQESAFAPYLDAQKIPVVGGDPVSPTFAVDPNFYSTGAAESTLSLAEAQVAKSLGKKTLGIVYCAEYPICAAFANGAKAAAAVIGGVKVVTASASSTLTNYTAQCLQMKNAGADALMVALAGDGGQVAYDNCATQGYKPAIITTAGTYQPYWLTDPVYNGMSIISSQLTPWHPALGPVAQMVSALRKYQPSVDTTKTLEIEDIYVWAAGKLFEALATQAKLSPASTPADVTNALYALKGETLGGLVQPLTYLQGQPHVGNCYFVDSVAGGKFATNTGTTPECISQAKASAFAKAAFS